MTGPQTLPGDQQKATQAAAFPPLTGNSAQPAAAGITGRNFSDGPGVAGVSEHGNGIQALSTAEDRSGIWADNTAGGNGVTGTSDGARGASIAKGVGVYGRGGRVGVYGALPGDDGHHNAIRTGEFAGFFAGDVRVIGNVTAHDVIIDGADCAEDFEVGAAGIGDAGMVVIDAGSVMVIEDGGTLHECVRGYDKRVAGVVSGAGGLRPGVVLGKHASRRNRVPIALAGTVYCKADAAYSPIDVGDLLTTSPTRGHAMRADDPHKAFGAVIGKALSPLKSERGLIPILVALQ